MSIISPLPEPILLDEKPNSLSILSICYYILGALGILSILFALVVTIIGIIMLTKGDVILNNPQLKEAIAQGLSAQGGSAAKLSIEKVIEAGGYMYTIFGSIWTVLAIIFTGLQFLTAMSISKGKRFGLCVTMSCINILSFPLGTILGVASLIILFKDNVKQYFEIQKQRGSAVQ